MFGILDRYGDLDMWEHRHAGFAQSDVTDSYYKEDQPHVDIFRVSVSAIYWAHDWN